MLYLVLLRGSTGLFCIDAIQAERINHKITICFPKLAVGHSDMLMCKSKNFQGGFFPEAEDNPTSCGTCFLTA